MGPVLRYIGQKPLAGNRCRSGSVLEQSPENGLQCRVSLDCSGQSRQIDLTRSDSTSGLCNSGLGGTVSSVVCRNLTFGFSLILFERHLSVSDFRDSVRKFRARENLNLTGNVGDVLAERVDLFLSHFITSWLDCLIVSCLRCKYS